MCMSYMKAPPPNGKKQRRRTLKGGAGGEIRSYSCITPCSSVPGTVLKQQWGRSIPGNCHRAWDWNIHEPISDNPSNPTLHTHIYVTHSSQHWLNLQAIAANKVHSVLVIWSSDIWYFWSVFAYMVNNQSDFTILLIHSSDIWIRSFRLYGLL